MAKQPRAYHRPDDLAAALSLLTQPDTVPLAGGTKLLAGDITTAVVDLQNLGLNQIAWRDSQLQVGATATLRAITAVLQTDENAHSPAALLLKAIRQAGPNTYRNAATLGGSIAARRPDSELLAALLVLEAAVVIAGTEPGTVAVADYLAEGIAAPHLITRVDIPWQEGTGGSERVARTPADYPIVSVTCWQPTGEPARLAATGVGERPLRLADAEAGLAGGGSVEDATAAATTAVTHPGDFRGDSAYRAEMAAVLTRRVLGER